jgi:hypothetical protein
VDVRHQTWWSYVLAKDTKRIESRPLHHLIDDYDEEPCLMRTGCLTLESVDPSTSYEQTSLPISPSRAGRLTSQIRCLLHSVWISSLDFLGNALEVVVSIATCLSLAAIDLGRKLICITAESFRIDQQRFLVAGRQAGEDEVVSVCGMSKGLPERVPDLLVEPLRTAPLAA